LLYPVPLISLTPTLYQWETKCHPLAGMGRGAFSIVADTLGFPVLVERERSPDLLPQRFALETVRDIQLEPVLCNSAT